MTDSAHPPRVEIRGLRKQFGERVVLDGIDLTLEPGTITTVIGKSGIGKSVLLKCLAGLMEPDGGEIRADGEVVHDGVPGCVYMFQHNALFDSMTVEENIALPLHEATLLPKREIAERTAALLERLELTPTARQYPPELSGGMQKRVAFARALILSPRLVLCDEPTTGLDPLRRELVFSLLRRYRREEGFSVLIVSHDVPQVFELSDQIAYLDGGRIAHVGDRESFVRDAPPKLCEFLDCARGTGEAVDVLHATDL